MIGINNIAKLTLCKSENREIMVSLTLMICSSNTLTLFLDQSWQVVGSLARQRVSNIGPIKSCWLWILFSDLFLPIWFDKQMVTRDFLKFKVFSFFKNIPRSTWPIVNNHCFSFYSLSSWFRSYLYLRVQ